MTTTLFTTPLMLGIAALALIIGLAAQHNELSALSGLLLAIVAGANLLSRRSLQRLRTSLRVSRQKLFPDESLSLAIDVENAKLLPVSLRVSIPLGSALPGQVPTGHASLFAFQRATFEWQVTPQRRGVHTLGPIELEAADPLGFFPRQRLAAACEIVVYPRLVPLKPNAVPRRDFFGQRSLQGPVEDPVLISGMRDYQPGRAARFIHWKASARLHRLIEKMCEAAEHESVLLVVRAQGFDGAALERTLEVVASLAEQLDRQRCAFGLVTDAHLHGGGAQVISVARREGQLAQLMEVLARIETGPTADLNELLHQALSYGLTIVCFTFQLDADMSVLAELFRRRRLPFVSVRCGGPVLLTDHSAISLEELRD